jgi:hypothetical protein
MPKVTRIEGWPVEESPCELCPHAGRCRAQLLACDAFLSFVTYGGRRWRTEAREPAAWMYRKVYGEAVAA